MERYPRTLFVTPAAFNHVTGGGITFSNLFRGWPADRLATVHNDTVPTTDDVCRHYYRLGPAEIARWPRLRAAAPVTGATPGSDGPRTAPRAARLVKRWIAGNGWPDCGRMGTGLEAWVAAFRPQLLYTILGTIGMMEVVDAVRRRFDLPLVVHFMDDWPSWLYRGGVLSFAARARMDALIWRLVDSATERMAIGDAMSEAYARRYDAPFTAFQNTIDLPLVEPWLAQGARGKCAATKDGTLRVLYVGSIFDNAQAQSLMDIARAVATLAAGGRAIRFDLYCPLHLAERFRPRLEIAPCVRLHDTIADDARFFRTIAAADLLVLPVNFDAESVRLIRYSMPTKLPAYLASGTATLVYGPAGVAQVEDARHHGWGYVLDRSGADGVAVALATLADDSAQRAALAERARRLAAARHDAATVRRDFQARLSAAAMLGGHSKTETTASAGSEKVAAARGAG